jgi:hypothetical protein
MSDRALNVDVVPVASEQSLSVRGSDQFIHAFSCPFSKSGKFIFDINDQLKAWLPGKGKVDFISLTAFVSFEDVGGRFLIAMVAKGASVTDYTEARVWPNRKLFSSNAQNVGKDEEHLFMPPEGFTTMLFPQTGPAPMFDILLYNSSSVAGNVDLFIKVSATGPYVHRYKVKWGEAAESLKGF